jgi:hypothetical protein
MAAATVVVPRGAVTNLSFRDRNAEFWRLVRAGFNSLLHRLRREI